MKFAEKIEEIIAKEKGKVVLVRCGIFFILIGKDALLLNKLYGLKVVCFKKSVCKVGMPVNSVLKYLERLEEDGYSYVMYDYDKETKELVPKYCFDEGKTNPEEESCKNCEECPCYNKGGMYDDGNIYEILERRKGKRQENG